MILLGLIGTDSPTFAEGILIRLMVELWESNSAEAADSEEEQSNART